MKFFLKVNCTNNNTILTLTNKKQKTLTTLSTGSVGVKGSKRSTPFAAERVAFEINNCLKKYKRPHTIVLVFKGIGKGRFNILKGLKIKLKILKLINATHPPHNGCKPKKKRRK